jgi:hypothetical protein
MQNSHEEENGKIRNSLRFFTKIIVDTYERFINENEIVEIVQKNSI